MNNRYIFGALFLGVILTGFVLSVNDAKGTQSDVPHYPDSSGGPNHVLLIPQLAKANRDNGMVQIPFVVKNDSDKQVHLVVLGLLIDGLATFDQKGEIKFIQNLHAIGNHWSRSGDAVHITLGPGETYEHLYTAYSVETLADVTEKKIFGILSGNIANKAFEIYSVPFVVPPELTKLPYEDLGPQAYLSVIPDLTKMYFDGGSFKAEPGDLQRAESNYADWMKNGWAQDLTIPIAMKNTSNREVAVAIDEVRFYIAGNDEDMNRVLKMERWEYLKISGPILKPGESISSEISGRDYITIKFLEDGGYKPGDKLIAVVGGRIPNTNKIFECYSAPFELPPLPKGEPSAATNP